MKVADNYKLFIRSGLKENPNDRVQMVDEKRLLQECIFYHPPPAVMACNNYTKK